MARKTVAIAVTGLALLTGGAALGVAPASADKTIYQWRTEDGTYAFTDDEKAIPDRYRDQVKSRTMGGLKDYERYTPSTPAVSSGPPGHEAQPAPRAPDPASGSAESRRIEYLRALNAGDAQRRSQGRNVQTLSIPTGGENSPVIDVRTNSDDEAPIVVERIRTQPKGSSVTRSDLVVRQGDRVLTIVKPQANQTNTTSDIIDEEDLLER